LGWLRWLPHKMAYGWGARTMSELRKLWLRISNPGAHIELGRNCYLGPGFSLDIPSGGTFIVGEAAEFRRGFRAEIVGNGRIVIGTRSICTYYVLMQCTTTIEIGDHCIFGQSTIVVDGQHRFRDLNRPMVDQGYDYQPIRIADHVTITSKATIMADIGERALVGANSVVTRPVPPFTVVAGAPARVLDYFGPPGGEPPGFSRPASEDEAALGSDPGSGEPSSS
jgi:acetyltransferase-like isoleucine patch superfamily enzyme